MGDVLNGLTGGQTQPIMTGQVSNQLGTGALADCYYKRDWDWCYGSGGRRRGDEPELRENTAGVLPVVVLLLSVFLCLSLPMSPLGW